MAYQLRDSLLFRDLDDECLILDREAGLIHKLNRTAGFIWRLHRTGCEPSARVSAYAQAFGVDEATAAADVLRTSAQLQALGLLQEDAAER